jgi:hypothetical protein
MIWTIFAICAFVICAPMILLVLFGLASLMLGDNDDLLGD